MLNPFADPHYLAGSVLARLAVNAATFIWAVVVLAKPDALTSAGASYAWIAAYVDEDAIAAGAAALSLTQTVWLFAHWPPVRLWHIKVCPLGYGIIAFAWLFVLFNVLLGAYPIHPTATACVSVIVALSVFAFMSNAQGSDERRI